MEARLLVVEPNRKTLERLAQWLSYLRYEVYAATDSASALRTARRERPDMVLIAVPLPDSGEIRLVRELRQETSAPLLFMLPPSRSVGRTSGLTEAIDDVFARFFSIEESVARSSALLQRWGRSYPCGEDVIVKPFDVEQLVLRIRRMLLCWAR